MPRRPDYDAESGLNGSAAITVRAPKGRPCRRTFGRQPANAPENPLLAKTTGTAPLVDKADRDHEETTDYLGRSMDATISATLSFFCHCMRSCV
jgi:hypothetical protein